MNLDDVIQIRVVCSGIGKPGHGQFEHVVNVESFAAARALMTDWDGVAGASVECGRLCVEVRNVSRWVAIVGDLSRNTGEIPYVD